MTKGPLPLPLNPTLPPDDAAREDRSMYRYFAAQPWRWATLFAIVGITGCASNRFQSANELAPGTSEQAVLAVAPRPRPIVPYAPAPAQTFPAQPMVPAEPMAAMGQPATPPPSGQVASTPPAPFRSLADNPNTRQTGSGNRWVIGETPKPGAPGTQSQEELDAPDIAGMVVNGVSQPQPMAAIQVLELRYPRRVVAEVASDANGRFRVRNLSPGSQYELRAFFANGGTRLSGSVIAVPPDSSVMLQVDTQQRTEISSLDASRPMPISNGNSFPVNADVAPASRFATAQERAYPADVIGNSPFQREPIPSYGSASVSTPAIVANPRVPRSGTGQAVVSTPALRVGGVQPREETSTLENAAFCGTSLESMTLLNANGQPQTLASLPGDLILLDFFGGWCGPCRQCIPKLNALQQQYGAKGLNIVGVACESGTAGEAVAETIRIRRSLGFQYSVLTSPMDHSCSLRDYFGVNRFPTLVLLDREGHVLFQGTGGGDDNFRRLSHLLQSTLGRRTSQPRTSTLIW